MPLSETLHDVCTFQTFSDPHPPKNVRKKDIMFKNLPNLSCVAIFNILLASRICTRISDRCILIPDTFQIRF